MMLATLQHKNHLKAGLKSASNSAATNTDVVDGHFTVFSYVWATKGHDPLQRVR